VLLQFLALKVVTVLSVAEVVMPLVICKLVVKVVLVVLPVVLVPVVQQVFAEVAAVVEYRAMPMVALAEQKELVELVPVVLDPWVVILLACASVNTSYFQK